MKYIVILLLLTSYSNIQAQFTPEHALISTRGTATVYVEPDEALLSFSILTQGDNLLDARAQNSEISSNTIAHLKNAGIDAKHIQTQYLSVGVRYKDYRNKETLYYEASQHFQICITNLDDYEEIIMGLLEQGIENLSSPTFRSTKLRETKDEARRKAIVAAREKAEMLAQELGQEIGLAFSISEVVSENNWWATNQNAYSNTSVESNAAGASPESGFALGQLEIKASIDVSFHLRTE
jgi:uncharacterized protein YggE